MSSLSSPLLLLIFLACAAAIWVAGVKLSDTTDVLSQRWHLGEALGGVLLLAVARPTTPISTSPPSAACSPSST
ncbi:hypothetical protein [Nocardia africana]|uniref:Uncharacterized protein n=1 Tax=Nocardia africana TaxID=134964 RepID=A0ABW6NKY2_9NOCA